MTHFLTSNIKEHNIVSQAPIFFFFFFFFFLHIVQGSGPVNQDLARGSSDR